MKSSVDWYQRWRKVLEKFKHVTNPHISFAMFFFFFFHIVYVSVYGFPLEFPVYLDIKSAQNLRNASFRV